MQYQLVLQFPEKLINFDSIVNIEDNFIKILKDGEVDGHDIGSGEVNFFILTNKPENAFKSLEKYLMDKELLNCVKSAYRRIDDENFVILYPPSLKEFNVQ